MPAKIDPKPTEHGSPRRNRMGAVKKPSWRLFQIPFRIEFQTRDHIVHFHGLLLLEPVLQRVDATDNPRNLPRICGLRSEASWRRDRARRNPPCQLEIALASDHGLDGARGLEQKESRRFLRLDLLLMLTFIEQLCREPHLPITAFLHTCSRTFASDELTVIANSAARFDENPLWQPSFNGSRTVSLIIHFPAAMSSVPRRGNPIVAVVGKPTENGIATAQMTLGGVPLVPYEIVEPLVAPFRVGDSEFWQYFWSTGSHSWLLLVRPFGAQSSLLPRVTERLHFSMHGSAAVDKDGLSCDEVAIV